MSTNGIVSPSKMTSCCPASARVGLEPGDASPSFESSTRYWSLRSLTWSISGAGAYSCTAVAGVSQARRQEHSRHQHAEHREPSEEAQPRCAMGPSSRVLASTTSSCAGSGVSSRLSGRPNASRIIASASGSEARNAREAPGGGVWRRRAGFLHARSGIRTHTSRGTAAFEAAVSTVPPSGQPWAWYARQPRALDLHVPRLAEPAQRERDQQQLQRHEHRGQHPQRGRRGWRGR